MNKIFRVIWHAATQRCVVASELAKGKVKSHSSSVLTPSASKAMALTGVALAITVALHATTAIAARTIIANGNPVIVNNQDIVGAGTGEYVRGVSATNNGTVDFTTGTITTSNTYGHGAFADTGAGVTLKDIDIKTSAATSHGLYARGAGSITGDGINIITSGKGSYGVQTSGGDITLTNGTIKTSGANSFGAFAAAGAGHLSISDSSISTTGDGAHAVNATGGEITVNNSTISAGGHLTNAVRATGAAGIVNISGSTLNTTGTSSEAAYALNGGTVNLTNTNINTDKINSYALRANGNGSLVNFDGGTITTSGATDSVQTLYAGSEINVRNATINTSVKALSATYGNVTAENTIINNDGANAPDTMVVSDLTTLGAGVASRYAGGLISLKDVQINSTRGNLIGARVSEGASIQLDNVEFNHTANGAGLVVFKNGTLTGDRVNVNIAGQDGAAMSSGIWMGMRDGDNSVDLTNSQITLTGANSAGMLFESDAVSNNNVSLSNSAVTASEGSAMVVSGTADTKVTTSGSLLNGATLLSTGVSSTGTVSNVTLNGDNGSVFNGDVIIDRANTATNIINLDNNSVWNGATSSLENLNLANGSQWNVTSSSAVDNLTLNNATLNMTAPGTGFSQVTLSSLNSTNATIDFKTHLMDDHSETDHLHITGDYTGNSNVVVQNAGGTGAQTIDGIELIRVDGNVNGTFTQQGRIVAGAYDYHLVQDANKWVLESNSNNVAPGNPGSNPVNPGDPDNGSGTPGDDTGRPGSGSGNAGDVGKPVKGYPITRPEAASYAANLAAANTLFTTSLDDRLGETHYIDADGNEQVTSLWLRNAGGHTRFHDSSGQLKTTGNRYVMQLGGDIAQWSSNGSNRFNLGVMGGYANAQSNTQSSVTGYASKGQVHGYSTGIYATWMQDNAEKTGAYVDSWALYNWFDNSVKGDGIAEESYKSRGITASVEAGYSFKVAEMSERSSVYLQPKAQTTWMGVKAKDHQEQNGTRVVGEGDNNLQTRLGVRAYIKGHNAIDDGKNRTFEPFIEANWVHNTETFGSSMNGISVQQAGARNLGEVKVGVDARLNKTVNLWGNIGQQMGDKGYSDTSAMVGVKVNF
ncbi:autotransporter outer membrane beta-barrel domain-containing protein [Pantoea sp. DY-5]|uniref:autotransporter outer membrane beta-barrel domain-containing protein n=1 Tax=Pantoea sp. DY-5 TaxID=2871488 RepID=UPI001C968F06|nr:autotransporter outer membrane beta-barrel domain-containing protein [Pantoea sp. DY-5]MBY4839989.1 autotransporter outer membrane beta-barrel domain-containing protein [Pantoea sp. DY-5]